MNLCACIYNLENYGNFSCCTYKLFYVATYLCVYTCIHVCMCGEHICGLSFYVTLLFDKIDNSNSNLAKKFGKLIDLSQGYK